MNRLLDQSVKQWYIKMYPEDEMGNDIHRQVTFNDALLCLLTRFNSVYDILGVDDSVIRERVFEQLTKIVKKLTYEDFYNMWLYNDNMHKYSRITKLTQQQPSGYLRVESSTKLVANDFYTAPSGWRAVPIAKFKKDLQDNRSLLVATSSFFDKPIEKIQQTLDLINSKINLLVARSKKDGEYRTVIQVKSKSVKFSNDSILSFDQIALQRTVLAKNIDNGTAYVFMQINKSAFEPDMYRCSFLIYFVEHN